MTNPYGPPTAPARASRGPIAVVWVALGVVLALTIASFVVAHTGDSPAGAAGGGLGGAGGGLGGSNGGSNGGSSGKGSKGSASGPLTVGGHAYVNACNAFPVATSNQLLGTLGTGYLVQETFAENIRLASSTSYEDVESSCARSPSDDDAAALRQVSLSVDNYLDSKSANDAVSHADGGALPGVDNGKLETKDSYQIAAASTGNVAIRLEVGAARGRSAVPAMAMTAAVRSILTAAAKPTSAAAAISTPYRSSHGAPLTACALMTTQDYEQVTKYSADTAQIERVYTVGPVDAVENATNECTRDSATKSSDGVPPDSGTTYLDGGFGPTLTVSKYPSAAAADKYLTDFYDGGQSVPGVGQHAIFANQTGGVQLAVRQNNTLLEYRAIGTVGTRNWTAQRYLTYLSGLARIALTRV